MTKKKTLFSALILILGVACGSSDDDPEVVFDGSSAVGWTTAGNAAGQVTSDGGNDALAFTGAEASGASFSFAIPAGAANASTAVSFWIKGDKDVRFSATVPPNEWNAFGLDVPLNGSWQQVTVAWTDLVPAGTFLNEITHLNWEVLGNGAYGVSIDDISFVDAASSIPGPVEPPGGTGGTPQMPNGSGGTQGSTGGTNTGGIGPIEPSENALGKYVSRALFEGTFRDRAPIYTYDGLLNAVDQFPSFADCCNDTDKKLQIAAFMAHVQHEADFLKAANEYNPPPIGGYCQRAPRDPSWTCAPGKRYFGRGALQLTWNYNYGMAQQYFASQGQFFDLVANPEQVSTNPTLAWLTALWFWNVGEPMTISMAQYIRSTGFGASIRKINGALECGRGGGGPVAQRIQYFRNWCERLGVDPELAAPLDC